MKGDIEEAGGGEEKKRVGYEEKRRENWIRLILGKKERNGKGRKNDYYHWRYYVFIFNKRKE